MSYKKIENRFKRISALEHVTAITSWDRAVMMPSGSAEARGTALSELGQLIHELYTSPEMGEWIEAAQQEDLPEWQKTNLKNIARIYKQNTCVSAETVSKKIYAGVVCEQAWQTLRPENNWKDFLPLLDEVIKITRDEATQRGQAQNLAPYQAMVDLYDPNQDVGEIESIFKILRVTLPPLIREVVEKQKSENVQSLLGHYSQEAQNKLGLHVMKDLGFNFEQGRLDISHHPFCGGAPGDTRITTRYRTDDFSESLYGIIHETGHASYEQELPKEWRGQPIGYALGMTLHESQSLLFEMQMGRSEEFITYLSPLLNNYFPSHANTEAFEVGNLAKALTRVQPDLIRTFADEMTYPLHVILRFEIEKDLIEGKLKTADLPDAWNEKMLKYLGINTEGNYKDGCMQDMHWTSGSLGYFPSYTLGALTAAQLFSKAKKDLPTLNTEIVMGNFLPLRRWLKENVWSKASSLSRKNLLTQATGEDLNPMYFLEHLKKRYLYADALGSVKPPEVDSYF